jgi:uncharacterized protein with FMN-binding domain
MKRFVNVSAFIIITLNIIGCASTFSDINASLPDLNNIENGIYHGVYSLPNAPLSAVVDVTVQNHFLTAIKLIEHNCSPIGKKAESIIDRIISRQSLDVDAVSGATLSSKTILKAVENALQ